VGHALVSTQGSVISQYGAVMRHGDLEWEFECYISDREPPDHPRQHLDDLQVLLLKKQNVFGGIPPCVPSDR
jgi:hypothetical protein